ncbi:MAG: WGR domain-containing protein, partial [Thermosynechococcaceae cyanobacterium]
MERRSLQYTDAKSAKFWTITLEGVSHTVQYGRVGTAGQVQTKDFGSEAEAQKAFQKLLQEKLKKGYVEISAEVNLVQPSQTKILNHAATLEISNTMRSKEDILADLRLQLEQDKKKLCELAALNVIPPDFWSNLDLDVRTSIAKQTFNVPEVYHQLAKDEHDQVRSAVASNLYTPSDILLQLAQDSVLNVRLAVAKNNSAPEAALNLLCEDPYAKVKKEVDKNRAEVKKALQQIRYKLGYKIPQIDSLEEIHSDLLIDDGNGWDFDVRWYVKKTNSWDWRASSLEEEAQSQDKELRAAIALNPNTPIHVLRRLADDLADSGACGPHGGTGYIHRNYIKEAVALNGSTPADVLANLAEQNNLFIYLALAFNPQTPSEVLGKIATTENPHFPAKLDTYGLYGRQVEENHQQYLELLYLALAHHPKIPLEALERIAVGKIPPANSRYTPISFLRHNDVVIRNDFSPQEAAKHTYRRRYKALAQNPQTTLEDLQKMLKNRDSGVRSGVGLNPLGLPLLLADCLKTPNTWSRLIALFHPALSPQLLVKFATSDIWHDRYAITQNPSTPTEILQQLAQDAEPVVQNAAKVALGLETSIVIPDIQAEVTQVPEQAEPTVIAPKVPAVEEKLEIVRSLNLNPEDYKWITWGEHKPLPKLEEYCCDRAQAISNLNRYLTLKKTETDLQISVDRILQILFCAAILNTSIAIYPRSGIYLHLIFGIPEILKNLVETAPWNEKDVLQFIEASLKGEPDYEIPIKATLDPLASNHLYHKYNLTSKFNNWRIWCLNWLSKCFEEEIYPYLDEFELQEAQSKMLFVIRQNPLKGAYQIYHLATRLKMYDEVLSNLNTWEDNSLKKIRYGSNDQPSVLLRLGSPESIKSQIDRLGYRPMSPLEIRACLAATEFGALDTICQG